VLGLLRFYQA